MKRRLYLIRSLFSEKETLGNLFVVEGVKIVFRCKTLELAWRDNQPSVSCVPPGKYPIYLEYSPSFEQDLWELKEVPNRSEIKIHAANYYTQLRGCIAVGDQHIFINDDEFKDVRNSRHTLAKLHESLQGITDTFIHIYGLPE